MRDLVTNCLNPSPSSNRQKHFLENEVSVVISTYSKNRLNDLLDAIDSINQQSLKPIEIILVVDPSPRVLDFYDLHTPPNVKIVVSEKPGLSNARNMGSKEATGKIIAYMDDDAVADKDWLRNIVEEFRNPDVVGVGGVIHPIWEDGRPFWFPEEMNWIVGCSYKGLPEKKTFVRNPIGCNMAFRKEILEKVGGFRPDIGRFRNTLLAGEEPELSMRILDNISNSKILHTPSAVVYHKVKKKRLGLKHLFLRSFYEGISKALIYV